MTVGHCLHSMFLSVWHKDFLLIWAHFGVAMWMLWQFIALQLGISHYYTFKHFDHNFVLVSVSLLVITGWLLTKTVYYLFFCISYKVESELNKFVKIANQVLIFMHSILLTAALVNFKDPKQQELGYLTIFIISTLMALNVVVTLNPISREERVDLHARSCCSSVNIMPTISFLFCLQVLELHHFLVATEEQNSNFYTPFHKLMVIWLVGLWICIQRLPERMFPNSPKIHKYLSS